MSDQDLRTFSKDEIREIIKEELAQMLSISVDYDGDREIGVSLFYNNEFIDSSYVVVDGLESRNSF